MNILAQITLNISFLQISAALIPRKRTAELKDIHISILLLVLPKCPPKEISLKKKKKTSSSLRHHQQKNEFGIKPSPTLLSLILLVFQNLCCFSFPSFLIITEGDLFVSSLYYALLMSYSSFCFRLHTGHLITCPIILYQLNHIYK